MRQYLSFVSFLSSLSSLSSKKLVRISSLILFLPLIAQAQTTIVADAWTRQPVSHASLYAKEAGRFRSAISDSRGRATISFPFRTLTVSHLNYERLTLQRLPDTIFLEPKFHLAAEVVVSSEPAWIRPLLRRFVKQKAHLYFNRPLTLAYQYATQSIATNTFYRFQSQGWLRQRHPDDNLFHVAQQQATIYAPDTTRLTDMTNMRRMLYEDFVSDFDASFIRSHKFMVGERSDPAQPQVVELLFRSRNHPDDRGSFLIDTTRCIILSATRTLGTRANKSLRVASVMLAFARAMSGYTISTWDVDYGVSYAPWQGGWYPQTARYKFFFSARETVTDPDEAEFDSQTGGGFSNMEATISLAPTDSLPSSGDSFLPLPRPWYIKLNTETERQQERQLANMPAQIIIAQEP